MLMMPYRLFARAGRKTCPADHGTLTVQLRIRKPQRPPSLPPPRPYQRGSPQNSGRRCGPQRGSARILESPTELNNSYTVDTLPVRAERPVDDADRLRDRAAKLFALAIKLRETRGPSVTANDIEQMAHDSLTEAEAIERRASPVGRD